MAGKEVREETTQSGCASVTACQKFTHRGLASIGHPLTRGRAHPRRKAQDAPTSPPNLSVESRVF